MTYLDCGAAVFSVEDSYNIIFTTTVAGVGWVEIDGKRYDDLKCGLIMCEDTVHKIVVPKKELDSACKYTIYFKRLLEHKSYFPTTDKAEKKEYNFYPVKKGKAVNIYSAGDVHENYSESIKACGYFGDNLDLLLLNGDISEHTAPYKLGAAVMMANKITGGEKPTVFARGNHDTRGALAYKLNRYVGTKNDKFYFTFTAGDVFGIVLDFGEDKADTSKEYGGLVRYQPYRCEQIGFLEDIIEKGEYLKYNCVAVICHVPLNSERLMCYSELLAQIGNMINKINPDIMLSAHEHFTQFIPAGELAYDGFVNNFPIHIGSVLEAVWEGKICRLIDIAGIAVTVESDKITLHTSGQDYADRDTYEVKIKADRRTL